MNKLKAWRIYKVSWSLSLVYLVILLISLNVYFYDTAFPLWLEFILKGLAVIAFLIVAVLPFRYLTSKHSRNIRKDRSFIVTAWITIIGYVLLTLVMLYVKLKTCDDTLIEDERWHCNQDGAGLMVVFIAIPIFAATLGLLSSGISWFIQKLLLVFQRLR
jgi:hypothetical protein